MTQCWRHPDVKFDPRHVASNVTWDQTSTLAPAKSKSGSLAPSSVSVLLNSYWECQYVGPLITISINSTSTEVCSVWCGIVLAYRCHVKLHWWWIEPFSTPNILLGAYIGFMVLVLVIECCEAGFQLRQALRTVQQEKEEERRARLASQARRTRSLEEPLLEMMSSDSDSRRPEVRLVCFDWMLT